MVDAVLLRSVMGRTRLALWATTILMILGLVGVITSLAGDDGVAMTYAALLFVVGLLGVRAMRRRMQRLLGD